MKAKKIKFGIGTNTRCILNQYGEKFDVIECIAKFFSARFQHAAVDLKDPDLVRLVNTFAFLFSICLTCCSGILIANYLLCKIAKVLHCLQNYKNFVEKMNIIHLIKWIVIGYVNVIHQIKLFWLLLVYSF